MLIEFSVSNYRSVRGKVTLSLVASSDARHPDNTFPADGPGKLRLVKTAAIYGANASGKSNVVKALRFMARFVATSARESQRGDRIPTVPFKLDPATEREPSEFEVIFAHEGERFVYGFSADAGQVHEEWLTAARKRTRVLFRRGPGSVEFGDSWRGDREKLVEMTRDNALLLPVADQFDNPTARAPMDWLRNGFKYISDEPERSSEATYTRALLEAGAGPSAAVSRLVAEADLGIDRLEVERLPLCESPRWSELSGDARELIESELRMRGQDVSAEVASVRALHTGADGRPVALDLQREESGGTQRLFALAGPVLTLLSEGHTLVIDELETKLHPLLTRALVQAFCRADTGAQLIFTTHDCGLLDSELFRRDQIWFTEKDRGGATDLYSLWDYDTTAVRPDENFRDGYLRGRYGAIPFIGELSFEREGE